MPIGIGERKETDMFGYIKPVNAELKVKEYELYRSVYCGLCAAMGKTTTAASRLGLSYDFVFLALVRMALRGETGRIEKRRCIAHPTKKRAVLTGTGELAVCARLSAVLNYHKLLDDVRDPGFGKKLAACLLLPAAGHIRKKAVRSEGPVLPETVIKDELAELGRLEAEKTPSFDRAAEPFGRLMAAVCACGFEPDSAESRIADEIGRHIGRFIYIADAADDLADDLKSGSYNPFIEMYAGEGGVLRRFGEDAEDVRTAMTMELAALSKAVELIDFSAVPEYGNILRNILYLGLPALTERLCRPAFGENTDLTENRKI